MTNNSSKKGQGVHANVENVLRNVRETWNWGKEKLNSAWGIAKSADKKGTGLVRKYPRSAPLVSALALLGALWTSENVFEYYPLSNKSDKTLKASFDDLYPEGQVPLADVNVLLKPFWDVVDDTPPAMYEFINTINPDGPFNTTSLDKYVSRFKEEQQDVLKSRITGYSDKIKEILTIHSQKEESGETGAENKNTSSIKLTKKEYEKLAEFSSMWTEIGIWLGSEVEQKKRSPVEFDAEAYDNVVEILNKAVSKGREEQAQNQEDKTGKVSAVQKQAWMMGQRARV